MVVNISTNYYMMTKDKDFVQKFFPGEYEIVDEPYLGYEIHIAKRSCGWLPLFQRHDRAYYSVKDLLKFLESQKSYIEIFNEYSEKLTIEEFKSECIDWGEHQNVRYMKYVPDGIIINEKYGWKDYFIESTEDDYDIKIPYDYIEYSKFETNEFLQLPNYTRDPDGYNFVEGDFC